MPAFSDGKSPVGIFRTAWMTVRIGPPPLARTIRADSSLGRFFDIALADHLPAKLRGSPGTDSRRGAVNCGDLRRELRGDGCARS